MPVAIFAAKMGSAGRPYEELLPIEVRRLRHLEGEETSFKRGLLDLDKEMLQGEISNR